MVDGITETESDFFFKNSNCCTISSSNKKKQKEPNSSITIVHFNKLSLQKNVDKLRYYIIELIRPAPDITVISKTKLKPGHFQTNIDFDGNNFVHVDLSTNAGVVGLYINNQLQYKILDIYNIIMEGVENLWVTMNTKRKDFVVSVIYRQPNYSHSIIEQFGNQQEK